MSKAPPDTTFRDARPGAEAKREALLERARVELAAEPLEVRQVFVNRVSVAAAGCTLAVGGFLTTAAVAAPEVYAYLASFLPGRTPAVGASALATTFVATLLFYFVARATAEAAFTRAMLRAANPSDDLFADLERLSLSPTEHAARLAERAALPARLGMTAGIGAIAAPVAVAGFAMMNRGGWINPGAIDLVMFPIGVSLLNAAIFSVVLSAMLVHVRRPQRAALLTGGVGLLIAIPVSLTLLGVMLVGVASGLAVSSATSAHQDAIVARAKTRSRTPQ